MRRERFGDFHARLLAELGQSSGADLLWYCLEEALAAVYDCGWPWAWSEVAGITYAPLVPQSLASADLTFNGVARSTTLTASANMGNVTPNHTGRKLVWNNEMYRMVNFSANTITVDRPLGATLTGQSISLLRDETFIPTPGVRATFVDGVRAEKLLQVDLDSELATFGTPRFAWTPSVPTRYMPQDGLRLPAPAFPLKAVSDAALTGFQAGTYYYYPVRVDAESGLESELGPELQIALLADKNVKITYGSGSGAVEDFSYPLRIYRSDVNPARSRVALSLVGTMDPSGTFIHDTNISVRGLPRYYDGPGTTFQWISPPDADPHTLIVNCLRPFNSRAATDDHVELGTEAAIYDLVRMFVVSSYALKGRDAAAYRQQIAAFRGQLKYMLNQIRGTDAPDVSSKDSRYFQPGRLLRPDFAQVEDGEDGNWVESLQSPWTTS